MQKTLHLPSAPTVLSVKTVPWCHSGRGVMGGRIRASARCDVSVMACVCVCVRDKQPDDGERETVRSEDREEAVKLQLQRSVTRRVTTFQS